MDAKRLDLGAIKAREQAATPGPWEVLHNVDDYGRPEQWVFFNSHEEMERDSTVLNVANAEFIAHARQDIPTLIEALETAWQENERLRVEIMFLMGEAALTQEPDC